MPSYVRPLNGVRLQWRMRGQPDNEIERVAGKFGIALAVFQSLDTARNGMVSKDNSKFLLRAFDLDSGRAG